MEVPAVRHFAQSMWLLPTANHLTHLNFDSTLFSHLAIFFARLNVQINQHLGSENMLCASFTLILPFPGGYCPSPCAPARASLLEIVDPTFFFLKEIIIVGFFWFFIPSHRIKKTRELHLERPIDNLYFNKQISSLLSPLDTLARPFALSFDFRSCRYYDAPRIGSRQYFESENLYFIMHDTSFPIFLPAALSSLPRFHLAGGITQYPDEILNGSGL